MAGRGSALAPESGKSQSCVFQSALGIFGPAFVIDSQLFAGVNFIPGVSNHFFPDSGGALVFAAPLGHPCQFLLRPATNIAGQPECQGLRASDISARGIAAALEETGESKQIEAIIFPKPVRGVGEHAIDFSE